MSKDTFPTQTAVVDILREYEERPAKADVLIDRRTAVLDGRARGAAEAIVLAHFRNKNLSEAVFAKLCKKKPKAKLMRVLYAAAADLMSSPDERAAKVVDSWVEFAKQKLSKSEAGFVNAVMRKFSETVKTILSSLSDSDAKSLSIKYSHPLWLVKKWIANFGVEKTANILELDSTPSEVFFRKSPRPEADKIVAEHEESFETVPFDDFLKLKNGQWQNVSALADSPFFYIQDPSTSFAPKKLAPKSTDKCLDLCAAPGGKSRLLADLMFADARSKTLPDALLVSVDFGGRMKQLRQNLDKIDFLKTAAIECDIVNGDLPTVLKQNNLPIKYDKIFVDAPCSNTGVLRRRPDARLRISEADISKCADIQLKILDKAKELLQDGGTLVYSTCSIESEENGENAKRFVENNPDFEIVSSEILLPAKFNDGAGFTVIAKKTAPKA